MSNSTKGGRGKRAPYETVMCRTPKPIKAVIEERIAKYRELVNDYENPEDPQLIAATAKADEKTIILNALAKFVEIQKQDYGKNGAQKDKQFNLDTRKWDAFREFQKFIESK